MAEEGRALKRRHLIYYLEVHDAEKDELLGHLVDLTTQGIKLVSKKPIAVNRAFTLSMSLPEEMFKEKNLVFTATSLWSAPDINPDFYDTGFSVPGLSDEAKQLITDLVEQVGFND